MNTAELERLWTSRPIRPESGRTVAGVCAGIGARYQVDPTLVKVAFVVATLFGGSGLLLYIAAWIAFPGRDAESPHSTRGSRHGGRSGKLVLLIVLAIIVITSFGPNQTWSSGGVVGAALMLLGWWLLFRRTPSAPAGTSVDTARPREFERWIPRGMYAAGAGQQRWAGPDGLGEPTPTGVATVGPPTPGSDPTTGTDRDDTTPPAWDPLGAARFAWDLPEPTPTVPEAERRRRSPLTLIVIGLALLVGAAGAAANRAGVEWFTVGRVVSLALVVVACGLLATALQRRRPGGEHHTGLVPIAILLSAAVIVISLASGIGNLPSGGAGERRFEPATAADIQPEYSLSAGSIDLDLRKVALEDDKTVRLENGMGEIKVYVPETMNVRAECSVDVGELKCPEGLSGGSDGTAGPVLTIDAHTNLGSVEVIR